MSEQQNARRVIDGEATDVTDDQPKTEQNGNRRDRDTDRVVEEVTNAFRDALSKGVDSAETIGDNVRQILRGVGSGRDGAITVRLDPETLARIDILADAGVMDTRSDAAAFLIREGVKARQPLFDRIDEKLQQIHAVKDELRHIAGEINDDSAE